MFLLVIGPKIKKMKGKQMDKRANQWSLLSTEFLGLLGETYTRLSVSRIDLTSLTVSSLLPSGLRPPNDH